MRDTILIVAMWIVTICTYISYIPQIAKLVKTKKSEDLSVTSWILWCISSVANLIYSVVLGRYELIIASVSETILVLAVLFLSIYYNYKNNYYLEPEEEFEERINRICSKDGNHMVLVTAMVADRQRRIENRGRIIFKKSGGKSR
jgi:uncharacterized protein with PQ loop repeat